MQPHPDILVEAQAAAVENPGSLITLIDSNGIFYFVSESAERLLGYRPEEALGLPFMRFVDPADIDHLALAMQDAMLNEQSVVVGMRSKVKTGGFRSFRGYATKLTDPDTGAIYILSRAEVVG